MVVPTEWYSGMAKKISNDSWMNCAAPKPKVPDNRPLPDTGQACQKPETAAGKIGFLPLPEMKKRQVRVSQAGVDEDS